MVKLVDIRAERGVLNRDNGYKYPELIEFIDKNGREVYDGTLEQVDDWIDYFASIRRLFILRNQYGKICAIACGVHMATIDPDNLFKDEPKGNILMVHGLVVHTKLRHKNTLSIMLKEWVKLFPKLEFILFTRHYKGGDYKIIPIHKFLRRQ